MIAIRRLGAAGTFLSCALGLARPSVAQSTDNLGSHARDILYQVSVGGSLPTGGNFGTPVGPLVAVDISAQMRPQGSMRLRVDAWMLDRRGSDFAPSFYGQLVKSRTIAAIVSAEFPIRFSRNVTLGPILGVGLAPYMHGVIHYAGAPNEPGVDVSSSSTGDVLLSVGLALRWRGLVVEQFLHDIVGRYHPLSGNDGWYAPLMIGWRF